MAARTLRQRLEARVRAIPRVVEFRSQFAPKPAFWIDGREFLHFEGDDEVEIRLTRRGISEHRSRLRGDERIVLRHTDWVLVRLGAPADVALAAEIAGLAAEANRRRPGEPPRLMPDERALARRRRFHRAPTSDLSP